MVRVDISQADVLTAISARLVSQLSLDAALVFEVVNPMAPPPVIPGSDTFLTVAVGAGDFLIEEQATVQCAENADFTVTGYCKISLDDPGRESIFLKDSTRGILPLKRRILKALIGHDLVSGSNNFLRDLLYAKRAGAPDYDPEKLVGWCSITFGVHFDWDLTT